MKSFQFRAKAAMKKGDLTISDLRHWFGRPYTTVWRWVESGWEPGMLGQRKNYRKGRTSDGLKAITDLTLLEKAIALKMFPPPANIGPGNGARPGYVKGAYDAVGVPKARTAR
jgi:hypothetical protein